MIYTYSVDHGDEWPSVRAGMDTVKGNVIAVQFGDAFEELDRYQEALEFIRDHPEADARSIAVKALEPVYGKP